MAVTSLKLNNFRSYEEADFKLDPRVTIVVGPNASGKTNLLEALYVLSTTRSFRAADRDLITSGQGYFRIEARNNDDLVALSLTTEQGRHKQATHNGVKRSLAHHLGTLPVVLFEPTDLDLINGAPEIRRRYLDLLLSQSDPTYLLALHRYRRVLQQRNKLLDAFDIEGVRGQIFAWDLKLAEAATQIYERRRELITYLNESLSQLYATIAGHEPKLDVHYLSSVDGQDYQSNFLDALARNLPRDLGAGFTTIGPHREDFIVYFDQAEMSLVGSRGEVRSAVLAFKLAELRYQEKIANTPPLFLLDDVFSELDSQRRSRLIKQLGGYQTVITTTDADAVLRSIAQPHSIIRTKARTTRTKTSKRSGHD